MSYAFVSFNMLKKVKKAYSRMPQTVDKAPSLCHDCKNYVLTSI